AGLAAYGLGVRAQGLDLPVDEDWPILACALYPSVLAFDHQARRMFAYGRGETEAAAQACAQALLERLEADPTPASSGMAALAVASDGATYEAAVAEVIGRIAAGEIFQANIARAWRASAAAHVRPFSLLQALAGQSAAPFAAYMRWPGRAVVSNSPERFVSVEGHEGRLVAETRPIKGTRPRGADAAGDQALAAELRASSKDRAENLMIVDLMRNDLARVCRPGTVRVPELFALESFANVHHLVSTVTGELAAGCDAVDLLAQAFPPGSVTGAPKIQAMKVIAELEPPRGPYCGSIFWWGADGAFDSSVLIRTAAWVEAEDGWRVEARAGAGIVADSDPAAERAETEAKIAALLQALGGPALVGAA
ncbi:anthranilate synthase component I family protein, partial [Phenylobacterium sp.]|uniref:anthranilate synthase component I family protein n=1 Tax=Phenylobacterium sp. TaxID=1871053 RepID=UPI002FD9A09C